VLAFPSVDACLLIANPRLHACTCVAVRTCALVCVNVCACLQTRTVDASMHFLLHRLLAGKLRTTLPLSSTAHGHCECSHGTEPDTYMTSLRTMHATRGAICGQGARKGTAKGASARPAQHIRGRFCPGAPPDCRGHPGRRLPTAPTRPRVDASRAVASRACRRHFLESNSREFVAK
jgi:hypothetical protein